MKKILIVLSMLFSTTALADHDAGHVDVTVGALSPRAAAGQVKFNTICAACHGFNGQGTPIGPPLIHDIYNPGHHGNASFTSAALNGVQQHHWKYGNMPAQTQVGFSDMTNIIAFVREVQEQNGIFTKEHKM